MGGINGYLPFVVDQSSLINLFDAPDMPRRIDTDMTVELKREKSAQTKYGANKEKCCMDAAYAGHLKELIMNRSIHSGSAQERHSTIKNYIVVNKQSL